MGKDLKGKNLGKGISQRKDGRYSARLVTRSGKRLEKYFDNLTKARSWLEDIRYQDKYYHVGASSMMTVDAWFDYWIENIVCDLSLNTRRNYRERYKHNIQPVIGKMHITEVKQMHCKMVLNRMKDNYAGSTIRQTYITMGTFFKSAVMNDIIVRHPMNGVRYNKPVRDVSDIRYLTVEEQEKFLAVAKQTHNYSQYALILETGIRTGELIGLTWDDIDWDNRTLTVNKTLEYRYQRGHWCAGSPKTKSSYRTIPLTKRAYSILSDLYEMRDSRKEAETLLQELTYIDRKTGKTKKFLMKNLVFINYRTGEPIKNSSYDSHLYKICDKAGIDRFSMHTLRHTYATRAIERNVQPKVLQQLLGHGSIKTTMDRYVHVTNSSMAHAVQQFEAESTMA